MLIFAGGVVEKNYFEYMQMTIKECVIPDHH